MVNVDGECIYVASSSLTPLGEFRAGQIVVHQVFVGEVAAVLLNENRCFELLVKVYEFVGTAGSCNASIWTAARQHCRWPVNEPVLF